MWKSFITSVYPQQGFIYSRKMTKTVMMLMAHLSTALEPEKVSAAQSRCILLLSFRKAYDTVDREFWYKLSSTLALTYASRSHTSHSHRHDNEFVINASHSTPLPVRSKKSTKVLASTAFVFAYSGGAGTRIAAGHQSLWATSARAVRSDTTLSRHS